MRKRFVCEATVDDPPAKKSCQSASPAIELKPGTILTDILGKKWRLGKTVGTGGFGQIYLVSDNINQEVRPDAQYVAKVESHKSGPLFVERNCYLLIAKPNMISDWKENNQVEHLGMPHYVASGSHTIQDAKYRFMVLPRFGQDLEEIFRTKKCKFNLKTVLTIASQTVDVLQYIHSKGYVHSDIKASNILLGAPQTRSPNLRSADKPKSFYRYYGCTPVRSCKVRKLRVTRSLRPNLNLRCLNVYSDDAVEVIEIEDSPVAPPSFKKDVDKIYLLDYGLAAKYRTSDGEHRKFCIDMRHAHAGTILFCSRDAHNGAQSRRSDLECLGYNMIYWLTSNLPWSSDTEDPEKVHRRKRTCVENMRDFLAVCFADQPPRFILDYFTYLETLEFEAEPDYNYCKTLFSQALSEYGYKDDLRLDFDNREGWGRKQKKTKCVSENRRGKRAVGTFKIKRSPLKSNLPVKPMLRRGAKVKRKMKWFDVLDPEAIMKQKSRERKLTESSDGNVSQVAPMTLLDLQRLNPTPAMLDMFHRARDRSNNIGGGSPRNRGDTMLEHIEGYTSAMMEIHNRIKELAEMELAIASAKSRSNNRLQRKAKGKKKPGRPCKQPCRLQPNIAVLKKDQPKAYALRGG